MTKAKGYAARTFIACIPDKLERARACRDAAQEVAREMQALKLDNAADQIWARANEWAEIVDRLERKARLRENKKILVTTP